MKFLLLKCILLILLMCSNIMKTKTFYHHILKVYIFGEYHLELISFYDEYLVSEVKTIKPVLN